MKKLSILLASILLAVSCQKIEPQYSCDPIINQYVVENIEELSLIDVNELSSYDYLLQKAVFNSWNFEKKRSAWLDKLNYILSNEDLNSNEIDHINKLIDYIQPDFFSDEFIQQNSKYISQFKDEWIEYAYNELGWSKQYIAFITYRLYLNWAQFEDELLMLSIRSESVSPDPGGNCDCNVADDFCGVTNDCLSSGCTIGGGCGWIWSEQCDGNCSM